MSSLQIITQKSKDYIISKYGNLVSPEEPVFDEKKRLWKVKLSSEYPRLIKNDQPEERFIRTLLIKDLGTIWLNEKQSILEERSSSRTAAIETLRIRLKTWADRAENIIVKSSAYQLANTGIANVFLNPIRTILSVFLEEEDYLIRFEELENSRSNYLKWISLLEDLNLVRKKTEGFVYGNMFTELLRASDDQQFMKNVLAYVIRERYPVLKEAFGVKQFETLVHMDSCYYVPALQAGIIICQKPESLFRRYFMQYNRYKPELELKASLRDLCSSKALIKKDNCYYGNEDLFNNMLAQSEELFKISSPRI
ncbi:MAG: hypothetical protein GX648_01130 [Crenarchaeota archaeon]|nr:hypothetical protein [Thermoproteota archaeon]